MLIGAATGISTPCSTTTPEYLHPHIQLVRNALLLRHTFTCAQSHTHQQGSPRHHQTPVVICVAQMLHVGSVWAAVGGQLWGVCQSRSRGWLVQCTCVLLSPLTHAFDASSGCAGLSYKAATQNRPSLPAPEPAKEVSQAQAKQAQQVFA